MNTNNTKFTFNKKGFALSLACVGLLATAGNAAAVNSSDTAQNTVTQVSNTNNWNIDKVSSGGAITVAGAIDTLGFSSGGGMAIDGAQSTLNINGTYDVTTAGYIKNFNVFNSDPSNTLTIKGENALKLNVNTGIVNLGSATVGSGALTIGSGGSFEIASIVDTVNLDNITLSGGANKIANSGTITNFNWNQNIQGASGADAGSLEINNSKNITNFTIAKNGGFAVNLDADGSGATFTLANSGGVIDNFINLGTLTGNADHKDALYINNTGTIKNFTNEGAITNAIVSGGVIDTFKNTSAMTGVALSGTITSSFENSGVMELSGGASTFTFNSGGSFSNLTENARIENASLTLVALDTFKNEGVINNSTLTITKVGSFENAGAMGNITFGGTGVINSFNNTEKGTINASGTSTITVDTLFNNAGTINDIGTTSIALKGATVSVINPAKLDVTNSGIIAVNSIKYTDTVKSFTNASTGEIKAQFSGGANAVFNTFTNEGKIAISGGTIAVDTLFSNAENAVISNITNATIDLKGAAAGAAKLDVTNAGTIAVNTIKYDNKIKSFTNASTGVIETTFTNGSANAVINNFLNEGKITTSDASSIKVDTLFNNAENAVIAGTDTSAITLAGATVSATNSAKLDATNAGTINLSKIAYTDTVRSFVNEEKGSIVAQFSGGAGAVFNSFINKGSITASSAASDINVNQVFLNDKNAVINQLNTATIALNGATKSSDDVILTATNAGTIVVDKIVVNGTVASFANAATGVIQTTFSGGTTNAVINNFTNEGKITASGASVITINKVFNNAENAVISTIAGTGNSNTITLQGVGNINDDIVLTATNAGTITDASIVFKDTSRSFANTAKGVIQNATFNGSNGLVQNFDNAGTILNSTLTVDATNFNNTGTIVERDTTQGTIGLYGLTATDAVSFNNSGVIKNFGNAVKIENGARNATFTNTGTIAFADNATKGLVEVGEKVTLNFNNADEIKFNANNTSAAISAIVSGGAVPTAKANIINTGKIALGANGQHIDLTNFDSVNVQEWHLKDIKTANAFNGNNVSSGLDKIVVTGALATSATDKTIKNLTFERGSIVINPTQQNAKFEVGQAYLLDRIVVDKSGNPVQEVYNINATTGAVTEGIAYDGTGAVNGVYKQTLESLKEGATVKDPRLVTVDTISFTDPIFVMNAVDAYGALRDTATGNLTTKLGKVGEVADVTTGARYEADGVIDSFQVGVDTARGAGAATVQNAVNSSITRNAFIGNVVNTAVNSTLATLNNLNRVSYNDAEVDFDKLEKYAAVSSDVTDQTYAKDSNVYVMPYYRSTSVDLAGGDSLDADTYGIVLGGNKNLGNAGVIGLFLGYESSDGNSNIFDNDDDTFFGGINYYKTLGGTSTYDYFVKGMLRLANTSTDITQQGQGTRSADTFSYGIEANAGMNFYNGIHTITPEVGLSYDRVSVDGFKFNNGVEFQDEDINLVVGKIGLNWLAQFTESISTNVGFGIRYNFNDDFDAGVKLVNTNGDYIGHFSNKTDLGDFYYYLNLGVNYAITSNWELGVMYNGDFSSDASSHAGFVKLGYWW